MLVPNKARAKPVRGKIKPVTPYWMDFLVASVEQKIDSKSQYWATTLQESEGGRQSGHSRMGLALMIMKEGEARRLIPPSRVWRQGSGTGSWK
jgi:hypothetical protein